MSFVFIVGIEVVKEGIRKLRFNQQLKKSESGAKTRKVELTISIDGVAIQEPRSHTILHQFPLHRISYCADDKGEKKFFSFIAKQPNQGKQFTVLFENLFLCFDYQIQNNLLFLLVNCYCQGYVHHGEEDIFRRQLIYLKV